jgi:hypothetical protein
MSLPSAPQSVPTAEILAEFLRVQQAQQAGWAAQQAELMERFTAALEGVSGRPSSMPQSTRALDHRTLNQVEKFDGSQAKWLAWRKSFVCSIRAQNASLYDKLVEVEKATDDVDEDLLPPDHSRWSGEVYNVLAMWCTGDAAAAMQSLPDCQGFKAWQALVRRFQPRTAVRAITLMQAVTRPDVVQDIGARPAKSSARVCRSVLGSAYLQV